MWGKFSFNQNIRKIVLHRSVHLVRKLLLFSQSKKMGKLLIVVAISMFYVLVHGEDGLLDENPSVGERSLRYHLEEYAADSVKTSTLAPKKPKMSPLLKTRKPMYDGDAQERAYKVHLDDDW